MRAADLLGLPVLAPDGRQLGRVLDIRLVQDGPVVGAFAALRLDGLVIGTRTMTSRLGYDRADTGGPYLLKVRARRLMAGNRYLPWDDVHEVTAGAVQSRRADLGPVRTLA